jgi:thioredoxin
MRQSRLFILGVAGLLFGGAFSSEIRADDQGLVQEVAIDELDGAQYQTYLTGHSLVLVDIYAPWCPPCQRIAPIIHELAQQYGRLDRGDLKVDFVKLNLDTNRQLGSNLGVRSIPTLIFYHNGDEVGRVVGILSKEALEAKIKEYLLRV